MYLLRESTYRTTLHKNYATTFASLRSKLAELHIGIEKEDVNKGEIVAQCLTACFNMVLWRCWSDRLIFEVKALGATKTQVTIYTVPNLFRLKVEKNEETIELNKLVSQLFN